MAQNAASKNVSFDLLEGNKLYLIRAKIVFPYLVRQAKSGRPIYYSELASEVGIPNARNLNYVLGAIGNALIKLGKKHKKEIPPIQCLVINKKYELPGEGFDGFMRKANFSKLNKAEKRKIIKIEQVKIYAFKNWDWVIEELGLSPVKLDINSALKEAKKGRKGGEGEQHKRFKKFILNNPSVLGLGNSSLIGEEEYPLPSSDRIDIVFSNKGLKIGIEVKSQISNMADILRGLFQCVKYKHLIEAEQIVNDKLPNSRVILALQGKLPQELSLVRKLLGIEVIDNIKITTDN